MNPQSWCVKVALGAEPVGPEYARSQCTNFFPNRQPICALLCVIAQRKPLGDVSSVAACRYAVFGAFESVYGWSHGTNASRCHTARKGPRHSGGTACENYDDGSSVYMRKYSTACRSLVNLSCGIGCGQAKCTSLEVEWSSGRGMAWEGKKRGNNNYGIVHRLKSSSWASYIFFAPASTSTRSHGPSITCLRQKSGAIVRHDEVGTGCTEGVLATARCGRRRDWPTPGSSTGHSQ